MISALLGIALYDMGGVQQAAAAVKPDTIERKTPEPEPAAMSAPWFRGRRPRAGSPRRPLGGPESGRR
jgi:hypothetical protein